MLNARFLYFCLFFVFILCPFFRVIFVKHEIINANPKYNIEDEYNLILHFPKDNHVN